ncbi:MAG: hypothetical protein NTV63_02320, partial [Candidatus Woesearchaeota archaeon]|nr:hypothetical protein [Candidatus Woesearchaeota archaeon]
LAKCAISSGAGADTCSKDDDCKISHTDCSAEHQCVSILGIGANICSADIDCAPTTECTGAGYECIVSTNPTQTGCVNVSGRYCPTNYRCIYCESEVCATVCTGKECGTFSGCNCGTCAGGKTCDAAGICQTIASPTPTPSPTPTSNYAAYGTLSAQSAAVTVGGSMVLTVTGYDDDGIKQIMVKPGETASYSTYECTGLKTCSHVFTFPASTPGIYTCYGLIQGNFSDTAADDWAYTAPPSIAITVSSTGTTVSTTTAGTGTSTTTRRSTSTATGTSTTTVAGTSSTTVAGSSTTTVAGTTSTTTSCPTDTACSGSQPSCTGTVTCNCGTWVCHPSGSTTTATYTDLCEGVTCSSASCLYCSGGNCVTSCIYFGETCVGGTCQTTTASTTASTTTVGTTTTIASHCDASCTGPCKTCVNGGSIVGYYCETKPLASCSEAAYVCASGYLCLCQCAGVGCGCVAIGSTPTQSTTSAATSTRATTIAPTTIAATSTRATTVAPTTIAASTTRATTSCRSCTGCSAPNVCNCAGQCISP